MESQRSRIIQAITEVVGAQGYHGASLTDITGRAGISRKTFYEHFEDKQACFVAAVGPRFDATIDRALAAYAGDDPWPTRVRRGLSALLDAIADDPETARLCFVETLTAGQAAVRARNEALMRLEALYIPDDPSSIVPAAVARMTAQVLVGGLADTVHRTALAGEDPRELLADLEFVALSSQFGPQGATERLGNGAGSA